MDFLALAAALAQPPSRPRRRPCGWSRRRTVYRPPSGRTPRWETAASPRRPAPVGAAVRGSRESGNRRGCGCARPNGRVDELGPFLIGVLRLAVRFAVSGLHALGGSARARGKPRSRQRDGGLDHGEAQSCPRAIEQQLFLMARRVRTQRDCPHAVRRIAHYLSGRATARVRRARCRRGTPNRASRPAPPTSSSAADTP